MPRYIPTGGEHAVTVGAELLGGLAVGVRGLWYGGTALVMHVVWALVAL